MNTFRCTNCGFQVQRPTQPFSCPQCGRQAVGLFRVVSFAPPQQGGWPGQTAAPQQPYPQAGGQPQQPGMPQGYPQAGGQPQPPFPQSGTPGFPQPPFPQPPFPQPPFPQQGAQPQMPGAWPGQAAAPQQPAAPWGPHYPQQGGQPQMPPASTWPGQQPQQPATNLWGQPPAQQMPQQPGGWPGQPGMPQQPYPSAGGQPQQPGIPQQPYPQAAAPQQPAPQWPYPQPSAQQPGGQQPVGGQWPRQPYPQPGGAGVPPAFGQRPAGQAGMPMQGFPQGPAPRYPQPPGPAVTPPGSPTAQPPGTQPPLGQPHPQAVPRQGAFPGTPRGDAPAARQTPPPTPQNVGPGRTAFPPPPSARSSELNQPPKSGAASVPPAQPSSAPTPPRSQPKPPPARPPQTPPREPAERPAQSSPSSAAAPQAEPPRTKPPEPRDSAPLAVPPAKPQAETPRPASSPKRAAEPQAAQETLPPKPKARAAVPAAPKRVERPRPPRPERFVWSFPDDLLPEEQAIPLRTAPAVDSGGRIFLQYRDRLVALVEEDRKPKLLWEYVIGTRAPGPVVLGPQDTLRLHCCDGYLHCLDAVTGKQVWSPAAVGEPLGYAVPVVDRDGSTYVSSHEGGLVRVDSHGRVQKPPFFRSRQKFDSPAVVLDGVLYVGSELGYLFAIDIAGERGASKWSQASDQGYVGVIRSAPLVAPEKVIVVAGQDECLYGVGCNGALAWKSQLQGQILGSPVADRHGHLYIGLSQAPRGQESRGVLACLDGNSHKVRWEYRAAAPVESTPVIGDDDVIYFGDNAGVIHAVNFSGKAQWTAEVGSPVRSAGTLLAPQRLAFGLDNDSLIVLECASASLAAEGWPKFGRTLGQNGVA